MRIPRYVTDCSVCLSPVGVTTNWSRQQAGQSVEWRVARHRPGGDQTRRPCGGGGVMVPDALVFANERAKVSA